MEIKGSLNRRCMEGFECPRAMDSGGVECQILVAKDVVRFIIIYRTTLHSLECHTCDSANNEIQSYNHYYSWTKVT
jgi:hypothetical protein